LWFFICIAPRSTIIPSPELVCDYKTYLASVGVFFILAVFVAFIVLKLKNLPIIAFVRQQKYMHEKNTILTMLIVMMLPIGLGAFMRNKIWRSSVDFWADNVKKAPLKARAHNNYGVALSEDGKINESIVAYKRAIELDKYYQDPLSNIAVAYSLNGQIDEAIESLKKAIHLSPNYAEAHNNIGSLFLQKKLYDDAERFLRKAIQIRPYYGKAFYNLARLYEEKQQPEKVWEYLEKATKGDLDIPEVFFKLGLMSLKLNKYKEAARAFETTVKRGFSSPQVWFNLANAYFMMEQLDKAQPIYEKLVRDNPLDTRFIYNLAETFFTKKKYDVALSLFKKVTTLPKPLPQSFFRVANCLEKEKKTGEAKAYLNELLSFNAPEKFKNMVQNEIARLSIQEDLDKGKGSIRLSELKQALAKREVGAIK